MPVPTSDQHVQARLRALALALRDRGVGVLHLDSEQRLTFFENPPLSWQLRADFAGLPATDVLPADIAAPFEAARERCVRDATEQRIAVTLQVGLERRSFDLHLLPDPDGVITIVTDTTDEHARDAAVAALLREVSHRSKNLLAIVQSVAMQTAHHAAGTQDFLDKFRGRLHALSSTQDLVTESNWRGTYLHALVTSQLSRVMPAALAHVRITGENPLLGPNASLHIGLAIHELGANATLHGALANGDPGTIWIDAQVLRQPGGLVELAIAWQETGIAAHAGADRQPHFGALVLERIVPLSVGGAAELSIEGDSVHYRLVVPADQFET